MKSNEDPRKNVPPKREEQIPLKKKKEEDSF